MRAADRLLDAGWLAEVARRIAGRQRDPLLRAVLTDDAAPLGRRIAAALAAGAASFAPARRHVVLLDKPRHLVALGPLDLVLHAALGEVVGAALEPHLGDEVLSYRRRRGPRQAVARLRAAAAADRRAHPDVRQRGLWVDRLDVSAYADHVRIDDASRLWPLLDEVLAGEPPWVHALVRAAVRCAAEGEFAARGLPAGSPLANPLLNLYLVDVDRALRADAACYLRYGDDLVLASRDRATADALRARADAAVAALGLTFGTRKSQRLYWTGSGRTPDDAGRGGWRGSRVVPYCGVEVGYLDAPRVSARKQRALLVSIERRLAAAAALAPTEPAARLVAICGAARALLDPRSPLALPALPAMLELVSDRAQLAALDARIARVVARLVSGARGARAFRAVPWRALHAAGLPSLTALRNRGWR